jgi:DNA-binding transcriptional regulator GbsR (MarR family)
MSLFNRKKVKKEDDYSIKFTADDMIRDFSLLYQISDSKCNAKIEYYIKPEMEKLETLNMKFKDEDLIEQTTNTVREILGAISNKYKNYLDMKYFGSKEDGFVNNEKLIDYVTEETYNKFYKYITAYTLESLKKRGYYHEVI